MKFGKEFKKQMVPEWSEAYMDYDGFKKMLKKIRNLKPRNIHPEPFYRSFSGLIFQARNPQTAMNIENHVIRASDETQQQDSFPRPHGNLLSSSEREAYEAFFIEKLDDELEKVNTFYKDKVDEMTWEASLLTKQMDALIALRIKVRNPGFLGCDSFARLLESIPDAIPATVVSPSRCAVTEGEITVDFPEPTSVDSAAKGDVVVDRPAQLEILDRVKIKSTYETPISTIKGILKDCKEKELSFKKDELREVEERLKLAFVEFYQKLRLLQNYSFVNLLAYSKILKKFDKIALRYIGQTYMKQVDNSYFGSCDEVTRLLDRVEATYIKHFSNSDRKEGMKLLRPKPKREKHSITFFSGFLCGCSIALLVALALLIQTRNLLDKEEATEYMDKIYPLFSFYAYIVFHILLYAANIYFWRRCRINYPFIFGFKQGTELGYREVFLISTGLAVLVLATFLIQLHIKMDSETQDFETYIDLVPLGLLIVSLDLTACKYLLRESSLISQNFIQVVLCIIFFPLNIVYRSSRFFLVQCVFHCICAPLYKVKLPDFFIADQITSQIQTLRCLEYYVCYYGWERASKGRTCQSYDVYTVCYYIEVIIPFWLRFLQCMRRLFEEKDLEHGYNSLRYFLTIVAVVIRTTYRVKRGTMWLLLTIFSSGIATVASTYWDLVVDWGLLQKGSRNLFLRDKLMLRHKSIYFIAMALNVLLRFAWLQLVVDFDMRSLSGKAILSTISCLEILRRGIWNFFRIENEHLYNVGRYRAFKSVPLPFVYEGDDDKD